MKKLLCALCALHALCGQLSARAQDVPPEVQLSPTTESAEVESRSAIDLQNIVTTATKGAITVQEAPAIVTVIMAEDIRRWGCRDINDVLALVPGWYRTAAAGGDIPGSVARGITQGSLLLHDGIPLFDPYSNTTAFNRTIPLESIKRVEVVTGPGGVLWGAQSFLGIVNIITKDAADVDGVEASVGYGDGPGDRGALRTWLMAGHTFAGGRLKVFTHAAYSSWVGQELTSPQLVLGDLPPQPLGPVKYGPSVTGDVDRSWLLNVDGKITAGPFSLYYNWVDGVMRWPGSFAQGIVQPGEVNVLTRYDRWAALEYRDRFGGGRGSIDTKAYVSQFVDQFAPITFIAASPLLPSGLVGSFDPTSWRAGSTIDGDFGLPYSNRLLWGGEAFREWHDGSTLHVLGPDPSQPPGSRLPFLCPHGVNGGYLPQCPVPYVFPVSRDVAAGFLSDQWRAVPGLLLDAGARVQAGFGQRPYDPLVLFSGSLVWNFLPNWHLKGNFSQGFRPPVFNNTDSNAAAAAYVGNVNLKNELSNAWQGELNGRVLRNVRRIEELTVRADYSYSIVDNSIVINNGLYQNAGRRGISSAEFLARLYLRGDHTFQLSYTFLDISDQAAGWLDAAPHHWFSLLGSASIVRHRLDLVSSVLVMGAMKDPNRLPQTDHNACSTVSPSNCGGDAMASNLSLDRLPAVALLNVGLRVKGLISERVDLDLWAYNVLNQHYYLPDPFYDFAPSTETQPLPGFGFSFFASARLRY